MKKEIKNNLRMIQRRVKEWHGHLTNLMEEYRTKESQECKIKG